MEYLPRIHHVAALPQSPRVTVQIERNTREIYWTDPLHVDVQRHFMGVKGQQYSMRIKCSTRFSLCKEIRSRTKVISRPGSEKKWYSNSEDSPQSEWDKMAEKMMLTLAESGHSIFRATSPLSRGQLKSKGHGKLSIHYCADQDTITTVFRTTISVNQLSLYGAVAEMCEEYESCHDRTGGLVVKKQSHSPFVTSVIKTNIPLNDDPHMKNFYCKDIESQQDRLIKFCTDAGFLTTVEAGQYFMTKDTEEFSKFTDSVACREYTHFAKRRRFS